MFVQALRKEAEEQGRQMALVEPRAKELEQKVEEMQSKIQEKITLLVSRSEEHSTLIERSSSSVAMFSEKITSYEKEVKEVANSGVQDLDSFKQEVERKILELFDTTEDQGSQIESLTSNLGSVTDQSNRTLEDVVVTQAELTGMKKIVADDHELIVRRVADQKEAADLQLASISARFDRLEATAEHEVSKTLQMLQHTLSFLQHKFAHFFIPSDTMSQGSFPRIMHPFFLHLTSPSSLTHPSTAVVLCHPHLNAIVHS